MNLKVKNVRIKNCCMKKIVILSNHPDWTYNLRVEIIEALIKEGHKVFVVVGYGKKIDKLISMGCVHIDVPFNRHGKNLIEEFQLIKSYYKILNDIKPDVVLSYTIKPNLYGAFLCRLKKYHVLQILQVLELL